MDSFILKAGTTLVLTAGVSFLSLNSALATLDQTSSVDLASVEYAQDEDSFLGAYGEDGKDGANGVDGADGADGADGEDGEDGSDGSNGADGSGVTLGGGLHVLPGSALDLGSNGPDFSRDYTGETLDIPVQPNPFLDVRTITPTLPL